MTKIKTLGANILGDEETSGSDQEDDSSPNTEKSSDFASAARDENATDYGLELTHTNNGAGVLHNIGQQKSLALPQATPVTRYTTQTPFKESQWNSKTVSEATQLQQQKAAATAAVVRKPRKQKVPVHHEKRFVQDVKKLQNQQKMLMPRLPFSRLVREIMMSRSVEVIKITRLALEALQESSEMYLTQQLQDAYTLTLHRGRTTLGVSDMELLRFIRGRI